MSFRLWLSGLFFRSDTHVTAALKMISSPFCAVLVVNGCGRTRELTGLILIN